MSKYLNCKWLDCSKALIYISYFMLIANETEFGCRRIVQSHHKAERWLSNPKPFAREYLPQYYKYVLATCQQQALALHMLVSTLVY